MSEEMCFKLRQVLNAIFMIGAVGGIIVYFAVNNQIGLFIILGAMVFKMIEYILRFFRPKR